MASLEKDNVENNSEVDGFKDEEDSPSSSGLVIKEERMSPSKKNHDGDSSCDVRSDFF